MYFYAVFIYKKIFITFQPHSYNYLTYLFVISNEKEFSSEIKTLFN